MDKDVFLQMMAKVGMPQSDNGFWGIVFNAFDDMAIVDKKIEKWQKKTDDPEIQLAVWNGFMACHSEVVNSTLADGLYESHCDEILQRIFNDGEKAKLAQPTDAELLMTFSTWSLNNAPGHNAGSVMQHLFKTIFPRRKDIWGQTITIEGGKKVVEEVVMAEPWSGYNVETIADLKRSLSKQPPFNTRKMKPRWLWGIPLSLVAKVAPPVAPDKWYKISKLLDKMYESWYCWFDLEDETGQRYTYLGTVDGKPDKVWVWPLGAEGKELDGTTKVRFVRAHDFDEKWVIFKEYWNDAYNDEHDQS